VRRRDYQNLGLAPCDPAAGETNEALGRRLVLRRLWTGLGIEVVSTEWHRALHAERSEFQPDYAAIEIMRTGAFEKRTGSERLLADAGMVVFHEPGEAFEIRHPCGGSNRGTTLRIGLGALEELRAARGAAVRGAGGFRSRWAASPASFALAAHRLSGVAEEPDQLACEEAVVLLVEAALELDAGQRDSTRELGSVAASRTRIVQAFLNESFAQPLRLVDVARVAGCSVWHVSKQFRRATGVTIHAWLTRLRLRHALEALHDGAGDLTRVALVAGFSSHSHFAAAFRAEFGMTPAAARAGFATRA
jgi:AraC-like DNA-binding protein